MLLARSSQLYAGSAARRNAGCVVQSARFGPDLWVDGEIERAEASRIIRTRMPPSSGFPRARTLPATEARIREL